MGGLVQRSLHSSIESNLREEIDRLRRELDMKQSIIQSLLTHFTSSPASPSVHRWSSPLTHISETPPPLPDSPTPLPKRTTVDPPPPRSLMLIPQRPPPSSLLQGTQPSPSPYILSPLPNQPIPHSSTLTSDQSDVGNPSSLQFSPEQESARPTVGPSSSSDSDEVDYDIVAAAKVIGRRHDALASKLVLGLCLALTDPSPNVKVRSRSAEWSNASTTSWPST